MIVTLSKPYLQESQCGIMKVVNHYPNGMYNLEAQLQL